MSETNYLPEPRANLDTIPSRELGPPSAEDGGTFNGAVVIDTSESPRFSVLDGVNTNFSVYTSGVPIIQTSGFTWMTSEDTGVASTPVIAELYHAISSGTPQNSIGVGLDYRCDTTNAERSFLGRILAIATTAATPVTAEIRTQLNVAGVTTEVLRINSAGLSLFQTQILGARKTGWTAASGTATRTTWATHTPQTISAVPTQGEVQNIDNSLVLVATRLKALIDDLISHGVIGA